MSALVASCPPPVPNCTTGCSAGEVDPQGLDVAAWAFLKRKSRLGSYFLRWFTDEDVSASPSPRGLLSHQAHHLYAFVQPQRHHGLRM